MEVFFDHIVQSGVFVGNAWRHAVLIHIGLAAIEICVHYMAICGSVSR